MRAIRYWWLPAVVGVALFLLGIAVFVFPMQSYLTIAALFGWTMLGSGILGVVLAASNRHFKAGNGWLLTGAILEIILGTMLIFNLALSAATLPVFLGFWLLFRGFHAVGLGNDMRAMNIRGAWWTIVGGALVSLCAVWVLFQPYVAGPAAVIIWVGISLLLTGITGVALSVQLHRLHRPRPAE